MNPDIEDWKFNINRANEIVRLYGIQTEYFVKLILSFIVSYNVLFLIFNAVSKFVSFNTTDFGWILGFFISYLGISVGSIIWITYSKPTKDILTSICHFKDNEYFEESVCLSREEVREIGISETDFREDYKIQLYNLLKFQKNYYNITRKAKVLFTFNVICFVGFLLVSILIIQY